MLVHTLLQSCAATQAAAKVKRVLPAIPQLLLLSNSRAADGTYLQWPRDEIKAFLGDARITALFVPYAAVPGTASAYDAYVQRVRPAFGDLGYNLSSLHEAVDPVQAVRTAAAIVIGGGNTFHLLARLYSTALREVIVERVGAGIPYIGWSAGSVVACPTIATTNDMPIIAPPSLRALGLVEFQINAHYTDAHPPGHQGETRAERIAEFLSLQPALTVVGLREGSLLRVAGDDVQLWGTDARIFRAGQAAVEWTAQDGVRPRAALA
jgi:dipeptidase E